MKHLSIILIAIVLALTIAGTLPAQVFADALPEYISEVKIGMGMNATTAKSALAGYKILSDENGNPVDLNQNAGGGWGSKGEKVVFLGYKTTTDKEEAITDLALMNMKGGYSVEEYDYLMETHIKSRIAPFVDGFLAAINEYRANLKSENSANRQRAEYVKAILNKLIDDDTGKGLGDLLEKTTKYEMGVAEFNKLSAADRAKTDVVKESDRAYDKLSDSEKADCADILTILAQSNGKAVLMLENLITRAADTNEETWIDRFSSITYKDLTDMMDDMLPEDAGMELAKKYDSDARKILGMWNDLSEQLNNADSAQAVVKKFDEEDIEERLSELEYIDEDSDSQAIVDMVKESRSVEKEINAMMIASETVAVRDYLASIEYGKGTLLDFFSQSSKKISEDITVLYPLVASLTEGQTAGLDFVSLKELIAMAMTTENGFSDKELESIEKISVYDGVNRDLYKKGGVALTSDSLRSKKQELEEDNNPLGGWTIASMVLTGATFVAFAVSAGIKVKAATWLHNQKVALKRIDSLDLAARQERNAGIMGPVRTERNALIEEYATAPEYTRDITARSSLGTKLMIGFSVAMVILSLVTTYLLYEDLVSYYNTEFTPIPHYMVDEKDITVFDENNNKIVIQNQPAYYKAVECNRTPADEKYKNLGTCADMNGDVGRQWLALYAQKSDTAAPILADSLIVKVNNTELPAGYRTGIHMFGTGTAFNLNNELYDWNRSAPSVMVYFKTDTAAASSASTAGSNFTTGNLALAGVGGLAAGALISGTAATAIGKKKKTSAA